MKRTAVKSCACLVTWFCLSAFIPHTVVAATTPQDAPGLIVENVAPINIDATTYSGQSWIHLHNVSGSDAKLSVRSTLFVSERTKLQLPAQTVLFKGAETTGSPFLQILVNKDDTQDVRIQVTGLREVGESKATVVINDQSYPILARLLDVPFNVGVQTANNDKPLLPFERGKRGIVVLKNDDSISYPITLRLFIPGEQGGSPPSSIVLAAHTVTPVETEAPQAWFRRPFEGLFRNDQRSALLTMEFTPSTDARALGLPAKAIPIQLDLAYWSHAKVWGNLVIAFVLVFGAVLSMALNLWIPNYLQRAALDRRLRGLAKDTRQVSTETDSRLRVELRVQRVHLNDRLKSLTMASLGAGAELKQFEKEAEVLHRRLTLVAHLDQVNTRLHLLRSASHSAPPTLLKEVIKSVRTITDTLCESGLDDAEFQSAQAGIQNAESRLDSLDKADPQFAQLLAARVKDLRKEVDASIPGSVGSAPKWAGILQPKLPGLLQVLRPEYEDHTKIEQSKYHEVDAGTLKIQFLCRYVRSCQGAGSDDARLKRIEEREAALVASLHLQNWHAVEQTRRIAMQVEEHVFPCDILEALNAGDMEVVHDPQAVYTNQKIRLRVRLSNPRFDDSASREDFKCIWDFGEEVGKETGWAISHFFRTPSEAKFTLGFCDPNGVEVCRDKTPRAIHARSEPGAWFSDSTKAEIGRLALAMGLAVAGLIAGARDQFMKLDLFFGLMAVLLLGFNADTIKNIFTKSNP